MLGKIAEDSRVALAGNGGSPKPDTSSVEGLQRTLLEAKSIAYSNNISGLYLTTELFPKLGIADAIAAKSHRIEGEPVAAAVARGEAQIAFQQISELLPVPGVDFVGPLPAKVQRVTVFSAGVGAGASAPDTARRFIQFLSSPDESAIIAKTGLEPLVEVPKRRSFRQK